MNIHIFFAEPAQYTLDQIENVYCEFGIKYSFIKSKSKTTNNSENFNHEIFFFDSNSKFSILKHIYHVVSNNKLLIVHGYNYWFFIFILLFSFFSKTYVGIDSDTPYAENIGVRKWIKKIYLNIIFRHPRILGLAGGNYTHKDLFYKFGMHPKKVFLMPMMINNSKFYYESKELNNDFYRFLFVGRLEKEKNVEMLIESFINISKNNKSVLTIVGSGDEEVHLTKLARNHSNIIFTGKLFKEELINIFKKADTLVLPSNFEPWGLVVNEALCSKLSVICSDKVGANRDLIIDCDSGYIFENQLQLEQIMLNCINNPKLNFQKAQNGFNYMKNYWNYNLYKNSLNQIIQYVDQH